MALLSEMLGKNMTPTLGDYHSSLRACASRRRCVCVCVCWWRNVRITAVEQDASTSLWMHGRHKPVILVVSFLPPQGYVYCHDNT